MTSRPSIFFYEDYREYLKALLGASQTVNNRVSLRAFARHLDTSPSILSEVFKSKKDLSQVSALRIGGKLKLNSRELRYFCLLIQLSASQKLPLSQKSTSYQNSIISELRKLKPKTVANVEVDKFQAISEWYHLTILEMTLLPNIRLSPETIAQKLGITTMQARMALERLMNAGLLTSDDTGKLSKSSTHILFDTPYANKGLRNYHRQMLNKAADSLEKQPNDQKFVGSETFPIESKQLPRAREIIETFFQKMIDLSAEAKEPNSVYHLGLQMFDLFSKQDRKNL